MATETGPVEVVNGLLDALVRSGLELLGADGLAVASGPTGHLVVRASAGAAGPADVGCRLIERAPVPDRGFAAVRLHGSAPELTISPEGGDGAGSYAMSRQLANGLRVLLVVRTELSRSASVRLAAAAEHLVGLASSLVAAERPAALGAVRDRLREREDERRRWARELHDETLQQLGALQVLLTTALQQGKSPDPGALRRLLDRVQLATELVAGQIGSLRQLISELRPAALDDLGLTAPLQALARRTEQLSGIRVTLHVSLRYADGLVSTRLVPDVELAIYRVVQEALTNVRRHSAASRAAVTVVEDDDVVVVEVSDDGSGFDPDQRPGFGLAGMRERAELAGGSLQVGPALPDGGGTAVRLVVPATHRHSA